MNNILKVTLLLAIMVFTSCSEDDEITTNGKYAMVTVVPGADPQSYNYYLQSLEQLQSDPIKTIDNSKANEVMTAAAAGVFQYKNAVYINAYTPSALMDRWEIQTDGSFIKTGGMSLKELGFQGSVYFQDDNTAFIGGPGMTKIIIFNPLTMKKTGFIDFSKVSKLGAKTDFPVKDTPIKMEAVTEMVISGNYMYVAINYITDFFKNIPASPNADVLVIDLSKIENTSKDNSGAVVKVISNDKGAVTGAWNSGMGAKFMTKDEKGDVYVLCHNSWGYSAALVKKPASILRIKSGTTTFDDSYYFDIEGATLGRGNPVYNLEYAGNGNFFAAALDIKAVDPNNQASLFTDPLSIWYSLNLYTKTAKKVSDLYTRGALNGNSYQEGDKVYLPYSDKKEDYIMVYDLKTEKTKKLFKTAGSPMIFKLQ